MIALLIVPLLFGICNGAVPGDLITNLPGANFVIKFKQYSGYLQPDSTSYMHYWLVQSQNDPDNDPLLLWLNGGPGCSSLDGLFTENGPFRVTNANNTIEENVYAWNKVANVLYLESPTSVGFSYTTDRVHTTYGDNQTALLNYNTLKQFFTYYPEYNNRTFFISGESYAGIYLPTLAMYLMSDPIISKNFKGMAIGNGALSDIYLTNSIPGLVYEHALVGQEMWDDMSKRCCDNNGLECDYSAILQGSNIKCIVDVLTISLLPDVSGLDPYNLYDTCYIDTDIQNRKRTRIYEHFLKKLLKKTTDEVKTFVANYRTQNKLISKLDTSQQQYPDCYYDGVTLYLQRQDVRQAIHIPDNVPAWQECAGLNYEDQYDDMAYQLKSAIKGNVRVLIYNGDCDTVCNAMGDKQFINSLGQKQIGDSVPWIYDLDYADGNAGWQTRYEGIDFLSVRGSGHFVPHDKPREALQMIANFIWDTPYSTPTNISIVQAPMVATTVAPPVTKPTMAPTSSKPSQRDMDKIVSLPGANFPITFNQYSGYLSPDYTTFMHYWFVESQRAPEYDPLVLWLNGGPGCSSLEGLLTENGPFRITNVAQTIEENVYAWNKIANVLYLESPTTVGFSYTTDPNTIYNDNRTALLNYETLKEFFSVYPEYKTRDLYITGESYSGIYLPTLAMHLINDRDIKPYFQGMAIGNGYISVAGLRNALPPLLYEHSLVGERLWENMTAECCNGNPMNCDFNAILNGDVKTNGSDCFRQIATILMLPDIAELDPYNLYDTCYIDFDIENKKRTAIYKHLYLKQVGLTMEEAKEIVKKAKGDRQQLDTQTYPDCYYDELTMYLYRQDVRTAIHIPDSVPPWVDCSDFRYTQQYEDMAYQLKQAVKAGVRVLIYNGDVDTVCNFMGDKQFIASLKFEQIDDNVPWTYDHDYGLENAGWQTTYQGIRFITVRGSGHFVPADKPREALQMIANFIWDRPLSTPTGIDVTAKPINTDVSTTTTKPTTTTTKLSTTTTTTSSATTPTTKPNDSPKTQVSSYVLSLALVISLVYKIIC